MIENVFCLNLLSGKILGEIHLPDGERGKNRMFICIYGERCAVLV